MRTLGDNIRTRRKALGMTQTELAKKCGLYDASSISKIENNLNDINSSTLIRIASALGTTAGSLFENIDHPVIVTNEEKQILEENAAHGRTDARRLMEELFQLADLRKTGLLTDEEYELGKKFVMELMHNEDQ